MIGSVPSDLDEPWVKNYGKRIEIESDGEEYELPDEYYIRNNMERSRPKIESQVSDNGR